MTVPDLDEIYPKVKTYEEKQRDAHEREQRRIARLPKHVYAWNIFSLGGSILLLVGVLYAVPVLVSSGSIGGVSIAFLLAIMWFFVSYVAVSQLNNRFLALGYGGGVTMIAFYLIIMLGVVYGVGTFVSFGSLLFWVLLTIFHAVATAFLTRIVLR